MNDESVAEILRLRKCDSLFFFTSSFLMSHFSFLAASEKRKAKKLDREMN